MAIRSLILGTVLVAWQSAVAGGSQIDVTGRVDQQERARANFDRAQQFSALRPWDGVLFLGYNGATGQLWITPSRATPRLRSVNIDSGLGIFTGTAVNLDGPDDRHTETNIYKETKDGTFGSLTFGSVAKRGLSYSFIFDDLTVRGTLADGTEFRGADLIYIPEPDALILLCLGCAGIWIWSRCWRLRRARYFASRK